jgi:hypothetical protein
MSNFYIYLLNGTIYFSLNYAIGGFLISITSWKFMMGPTDVPPMLLVYAMNIPFTLCLTTALTTYFYPNQPAVPPTPIDWAYLAGSNNNHNIDWAKLSHNDKQL